MYCGEMESLGHSIAEQLPSTLAHQHPPDIDLLILLNYWNYYSNELKLMNASLVL
jgi:hypothetical protein